MHSNYTGDARGVGGNPITSVSTAKNDKLRSPPASKSTCPMSDAGDMRGDLYKPNTLSSPRGHGFPWELIAGDMLVDAGKPRTLP